ncbi:hypothetical protein SOP95_31370, partial [Pseudomonas sp. YuFO8]|nr:hypothetical protein [Pseudomonas sp. YuFO8]
GTVNEQGRVLVDIGAGYDCRCNLVSDAKGQQDLGDFFKALFLAQKPEDRVYELGMLQLQDADRLAPRSFSIRTMATDEPQARGPEYNGDGAVVMLVRTKGNPDEGDDVSDGEFDYLIPNDRHPQTNKPLYTGALVLASRILFDWYFQDYLQMAIGYGLRFKRLSESNDIARSLRAIAGGFDVPGFEYAWSGNPRSKSLKSTGPLSIKMYSALEAESLGVKVVEGQLLEISWHHDAPLPFHYHEDRMILPDIDYYYDAPVRSRFKVCYRPVLEEAGANKVYFDLEPGYSLAMSGVWEPPNSGGGKFLILSSKGLIRQ